MSESSLKLREQNEQELGDPIAVNATSANVDENSKDNTLNANDEHAQAALVSSHVDSAKINTENTAESVDDLKNANFDSHFENELDQIETDLTALSSNFKRRRFSKNEMDFLETELNIDMDSITDADFDIHLQKLISENTSQVHSATEDNKKASEKAVLEASSNASVDLDQEVVTATVTQSTAVDFPNGATASSKTSETVFTATSATIPEVKAADPVSSSARDEPTNQMDAPNIEIKATATTKGQSKSSDLPAQPPTSENAPPSTVSDAPQLIVASTTTSTTTPISSTYIPANSELFRDTESSGALNAYRALLNDSNQVRMKDVNHINAQLSALPLPMTAPDHLSFNVQMLVNTLPVLDNLATQILRIIAKGPYQKVMELVSNRESYTGIAFSNLVELFETTKRIYNSEESPFFTVENITFGLWRFGQHAPAFLKGREDTIEGTLRKVNLSTFVLATLGLIDLGFFFLNEAFLDVFCPPQSMDPAESISFIKNKQLRDDLKSGENNGRANSATTKIQRNQTKFLKAQAILYLELKTQAYISAIELGDKSKEDIIYDLFPDNMDEILLKRKDPHFTANDKKIERNPTLFTPAEIDFLNRCDFRKQTLLKSGTDSSLMDKYEWIKFLNDLLEYVSKNVGFLIWGPKGKLASELEKLDNMEDGALKLESDQLKAIISKLGVNVDNSEKKRKYRELESEDSTGNLAVSSSSGPVNKKATTVPASEQNDLADAGVVVSAGIASQTKESNDGDESNLDRKDDNTQDGVVEASGEEGGENIDNQTDGNLSLESSKTKKKKVKQNRPSTFRRIWTTEEEEALKEGLKKKGTHWTAILELYGPGGQINENLKNRSSLQLKDKARNWKMYYIKNNLPVPEYLQKATGEDKLKKLTSKLNLGPKTRIPLSRPTMTGKAVENGNNSVTRGEFTESDAYDEMFEELLPGTSTSEKANGDKEPAVGDEVVASELKDLVAEAFK